MCDDQEVRPMELWREIPDYPNYRVSNEGRVMRVEGKDSLGRHKARRILSEQPGGGREGNYMRVGLCRKGSRRTFNVHILVAMAWLDGENLGSVDHIDEDTSNNSARNLRWMGLSDNSARGSRKRWDSEARLERAAADGMPF